MPSSFLFARLSQFVFLWALDRSFHPDVSGNRPTTMGDGGCFA
jgi:hypothetical protein